MLQILQYNLVDSQVRGTNFIGAIASYSGIKIPATFLTDVAITKFSEASRKICCRFPSGFHPFVIIHQQHPLNPSTCGSYSDNIAYRLRLSPLHLNAFNLKCFRLQK